MGLKIVTDDRPVTVRCFDKTSKAGNPYKDYCLSVSSKDMNGNWLNGLLNVKFKKGTEIADKSKIKISNCFPIVEEYQERQYVKWMITDFEVAEEGTTTPSINADGFMDIPDGIDDELPFV